MKSLKNGLKVNIRVDSVDAVVADWSIRFMRSTFEAPIETRLDAFVDTLLIYKAKESGNNKSIFQKKRSDIPYKSRFVICCIILFLAALKQIFNF